MCVCVCVEPSLVVMSQKVWDHSFSTKALEQTFDNFEPSFFKFGNFLYYQQQQLNTI